MKIGLPLVIKSVSLLYTVANAQTTHHHHDHGSESSSYPQLDGFTVIAIGAGGLLVCCGICAWACIKAACCKEKNPEQQPLNGKNAPGFLNSCVDTFFSTCHSLFSKKHHSGHDSHHHENERRLSV